MLTALTLTELAAEVGGSSPAPGGGSVAALSGAMAASLVGMVCQLTLGKKGYEEHEERLSGALAAAGDLRTTLLSAVDEDTAAYLGVVQAYRLPKGTDDEVESRAAAIQEAMQRAAEVPLATAEACLAVLGLAQVVGEGYNAAAASDLGVGIQAAATGVRGAALNVAINLPSIDEGPAKRGLSRRLAEIEAESEALLAATWPPVKQAVAGSKP